MKRAGLVIQRAGREGIVAGLPEESLALRIINMPPARFFGLVHQPLNDKGVELSFRGQEGKGLWQVGKVLWWACPKNLEPLNDKGNL